jgi:hypothetical protein
MRNIARRTAVITSAAVLGIGAVSLAWASWTANGTGSAQAAAGQSVAVTTAAATVASAPLLVPGGQGSVRIRVVNANAFPVRVTGVSGTGDAVPDADHPGCTTTGVSFVDRTGLSLDVPAGQTEEFTIPDTVTMGNDSSNGCQGATFTIPVSIDAVSNAS